MPTPVLSVTHARRSLQAVALVGAFCAWGCTNPGSGNTDGASSSTSSGGVTSSSSSGNASSSGSSGGSGSSSAGVDAGPTPCGPGLPDCASGTACVPGVGCLPVVCTALEQVTCVNQTSLQRCNDTGTGFYDLECTFNRPCLPADPLACVRARICTPGVRRCTGNGTEAQVCNADGTDWEADAPCEGGDEGQACFEDLCLTACQQARATQSYLGCEYWGADLANHFTMADDMFNFAFVVSNTHPTLTAQVALETDTQTLQTLSVAPQSLGVMEIAPPRPRHNPGTGIRYTAYRLTSSLPVAAYQFNPLQTAEYNAQNQATRLAASTDASMLLPAHVLDDRYIAMAWQQTPVPGTITYTGGSLLAVVAPTEVDVTLVTTTASSGVGPGVPSPVLAGSSRTFHLMPFQVLQLVTLLPGQDWTGTRIEATGKVAVFAGNECGRVPANSNYCDHMEEQMFGLTAWGQTYVGVKSWARGQESDLWRILADQDGTVVSFEPPGVAPNRTLTAGEFMDLQTTEDFLVTASKPVALAQFFTGSSTVVPGCDQFTCSETGDPSMVLVPPTGQFRSSYMVLTPDTYQQDFVTVVHKVGADIRLDGMTMGGARAVGNSEWRALSVRVADGVHQLSANEEFGVVVYGYGGNDQGGPLDYDTANVSYGYPGGLNFLPLNPKFPAQP